MVVVAAGQHLKDWTVHTMDLGRLPGLTCSEVAPSAAVTQELMRGPVLLRCLFCRVWPHTWKQPSCRPPTGLLTGTEASRHTGSGASPRACAVTPVALAFVLDSKAE